jgi:hypothetical protein
MKKYNMISGVFSHASSSTWYKKPKYFSWDFNSKDNPISFYIDGDILKGIEDKNDGKKKFLWGLESRYYNGNFFSLVKENLNDVIETYEMIFTFDDELVNLHPKFKWVPAMGYWINNPKIYEKNKKISMITSLKTTTPQQKLRVSFADQYKNDIDLYGVYNKIPEKEIGLCDYMFSVCIENDTYDTYFTEKILDCFATGTIPVYMGTKNISKYFNSEGIIFLNNNSLDSLTSDLYYSKIEYVKENLERVLQFNTIEDFIYNKYLKDYDT